MATTWGGVAIRAKLSGLKEILLHPQKWDENDQTDHLFFFEVGTYIDEQALCVCVNSKITREKVPVLALFDSTPFLERKDL